MEVGLDGCPVTAAEGSVECDSESSYETAATFLLCVFVDTMSVQVSSLEIKEYIQV